VVFFGVLAAPSPTRSLSLYRPSPHPRLSYSDVWLNPIPSYRFGTRDLNLRAKSIGGNSALVSETEARSKKLSLLESALTKIVPVTRLESALANSLNLKPFRIRTYKKRRGRGATVNHVSHLAGQAWSTQIKERRPLRNAAATAARIADLDNQAASSCSRSSEWRRWAGTWRSSQTRPSHEKAFRT
jgi:hypothetical protein